jgi:predicted Zn-dependent peptidase
MSHLGGSLLHGMPILSMDELIDRIDAVRLADVQALARDLFAPEQLSVACVGPDERAFNDAIAPLLAGADARAVSLAPGSAR